MSPTFNAQTSLTRRPAPYATDTAVRCLRVRALSISRLASSRLNTTGSFRVAKSKLFSAHEYATSGGLNGSVFYEAFIRIGALMIMGVTSASVATDKQINDEAGVNAVVHGFEDAWNRHDMDAFAMLFATDADFVNVIGMRWVGRDAIKQHHAASHATIFKSSTLKIGDTTLRFLKTDVATARSVWTLSGITSASGQLVPTRTGILTHVLARIDGHWLIVLSQNTDITKPGG